MSADTEVLPMLRLPGGSEIFPATNKGFKSGLNSIHYGLHIGIWKVTDDHFGAIYS